MNFLQLKGLLGAALFATTAGGLPDFARAGGTYLTLCNEAVDRTLYIYRAEGRVSGGWWEGAGWFTANANTCVNTGLTNDGIPVAFAFALLDDAERLATIEVSAPSISGRVPMTIDAICVPAASGEFGQRNSAAGRPCGDGAIPAPVSFIAVTGSTSWDEFVNAIIPVRSNGRNYDLSAPDVDLARRAREAEADHLRWLAYWDACTTALTARNADFYGGEFAARACACETLTHEYVLSQTDLSHADMDYAYPNPWRDTVRRRDLYDVRLPLRECRSKSPKIDMSRIAPPDAVRDRLKALNKSR